MQPEPANSPYYIEDTLLLKFLITRYTEMLRDEESTRLPVWAGLGLVALRQNRELENAFKIMISSDSYTVGEFLTTSVDLFLGELDRLQAADTADYVEQKVERHPMSPRTTRKFLFWAWREGRKMEGEQDLRFYPVWEVVSWLALNFDEYRKAFEERCRFSDSPTEKRLEEGLEVLKAAIFGRSVDISSFQQDMLKSCATIELLRRSVMNAVNNSPVLSVELPVLLRYLLRRTGEMIEQSPQDLGLVIPSLGFVALYHDQGLLTDYEKIVFSASGLPPKRGLTACRVLFKRALGGITEAGVPDDIDYQSLPEKPQSSQPEVCREFLVAALCDGKRMAETADYEFISVFLVMSRLGLKFDAERFREFEQRCLHPDIQPQDTITAALEILSTSLPEAIRRINLGSARIIDRSRSVTEPAPIHN